MENLDLDHPEPYSDEEVLDFVKEWIRKENDRDDFEVVGSDVVYKEQHQANINIDGGLVADLEEFHGFTPIEAVEQILISVRETYGDNSEFE